MAWASDGRGGRSLSRRVFSVLNGDTSRDFPDGFTAMPPTVPALLAEARVTYLSIQGLWDSMRDVEQLEVVLGNLQFRGLVAFKAHPTDGVVDLPKRGRDDVQMPD